MKPVLALALALAATATSASDVDTVVATAEAAARARLAGMDGARLTVTGRPREVTLPKGTPAFAARAIEGAWPRRRFVVPVDVSVNGKHIKTVPVAFELASEGKGLVYAADLRAHAVVDATGVREGGADLARVHGTPIVDAASLAGKRLRRGVHGGDIAVNEDFETVPDIDVRQRVRVVASQGAIRLESGGTALAAGNRGDLVTVRVDGGDQPVRATVIDKGVTQVVQ